MDNLDSIFKMFNENMNIDASSINNIMNMFQSSSNKGSQNNTESTSSSNNGPDMPDIETIMKITKILNSFKSSQNDSRTNLLLSLKPYLSNDKKDKIDQYIKFLGIANAISLINDEGGLNNDFSRK